MAIKKNCNIYNDSLEQVLIKTGTAVIYSIIFQLNN